MPPYDDFFDTLLPGNYALTKSMELTRVTNSGTLWYTKKFLTLYYYVFLSNDIETSAYRPAVVISGVFEALGRGGRSLIVTMLRQLLIIPPLAFLLSPVMGLTGVWIAFPIAEAAASVAAVFLYRGMMKRMEAA